MEIEARHKVASRLRDLLFAVLNLEAKADLRGTV
jgi:hypothetical protein